MDEWIITVSKPCTCDDGVVQAHSRDAALDVPCATCKGTGTITKSVPVSKWPEFVESQKSRAALGIGVTNPTSAH